MFADANRPSKRDADVYAHSYAYEYAQCYTDGYGHAYSDDYAYGYCNCNSHGNSYSYRYGHCHCQANADWPPPADTEATTITSSQADAVISSRQRSEVRGCQRVGTSGGAHASRVLVSASTSKQSLKNSGI